MTKKNNDKNHPLSAQEHPLSVIFSENFMYKIPSYQRPYSWGEEETSQLFSDLYEFYTNYKTEYVKGYFLGSIVLVEEVDEIPSSRTHAEVVDGQQRLTTLTILLAAIRSVAKEGEFRNEMQGYIINVGKKVERVVSQPCLTLRDRDKQFFKEFIQDIDKLEELIELDPVNLKNEAQRNIQENSKYLFSTLKDTFDQDLKELEKFSSFLVTRCFLVVVIATNEESAFRFFSVMNSRGLNLQATDIIKADVIGDINEDKEDDFNRRWEDMEDDLGRVRFNDLFHFIRTIYVKKKAQKSLQEEFKEHVIKKENNSEKLIGDVLEPYSESLSTIVNSNYKSSKSTKKVNSYLDWLNQNENSDWMAVAVFFLSKHKENPEMVNLFFQKLERLSAYLYFCERYKDRRIRRYNQVITGLEETDGSKNFPESINLSEDEITAMKDILEGDIYKLPNKKRKYIILRLDSFLAGEGAKYERNICTIEHVLPQTVDEKSNWNKNWPDPEKRKEWVHRIANLVLLNRRRNAQARNHDFEKKKEIYLKNEGGLPPYSLTIDALQVSEWTVEHLEERQEKLLSIFYDNWEI